MEETIVEFLKKSLYEKIFLYNDLLLCFKKEKEALAIMDMDNLWNISEEKDELCSKINSIRQKMFSAVGSETGQQYLTPAMIMDLVPEKNRSKFHELYYALRKLKNEINVMRELNMHAVDHSLKFLDEIISIITGQVRHDVIYNGRCRLNQSGSNMILSREV